MISKKSGRGEQIENQLPKAKLGVELISALKAAWDKLGLMILMSVTWALLVSLPLSFVRWLPHSISPVLRYSLLVLIPIFGSVPSAGAAYIAQEIGAYREVSYAIYLQKGWDLRWQSLRLSLIHWGVIGAIGFASWFYLRIPHWSAKIGLLFCVYFAFFWCMMAIYHYPILIAQETGLFDETERRAKRGAGAVLRRCFFLAVGRPLFAIGLLLALSLFGLLTLLTAVLPILLWSGFFSLLATLPVRALLVQFDVLPVPTPPLEDASKKIFKEFPRKN